MYDRKKLAGIATYRKKWSDGTLAPNLRKSPPRLDRFSTVSDEEIDLLYTPDPLSNFEYEEDLGYPGQYPYTRGVQPTMYRGRLWTMRQFAGFGSAEDTNARFKFLLSQ
ncbi:MAG: mmcA1, partial [Deltaproteobacteria bacterium]|nr:mmcA1 [Deltaproteobacteria bacterium]